MLTQTRPEAKVWGGWKAAFFPLPALKVSEWAKKYRRIPKGTAAKPGRWVSLPYQDEMMDAALEPNVSEVVLDLAAQTAGKTEILLNVAGYHMDVDPSGQLLVQPTVDLAEAFSKERLAPTINETAALKRLVRDPKSRDSGNTLVSKMYPGGSLVLIGANSPAGLAGRPRRVILLDEVDRYPASAGSEGDPCALADKRAETFPNAVKVKTSTPTIKGASKIESLLEQSDHRKWHCLCPRCQHEQVWAWSQVKWEGEDLVNAWLECDGCHAHLTDEERVLSVRDGVWKPTRAFTGIRGYWLNGINTLFDAQKGFTSRLHQMAADFLKAKHGGPETMKVWINTFLAESYEESATVIDATAITGKDEEYEPNPCPEGVLVLTASGDVQENRIEVEFAGWGRDEERWGLGKYVLNGNPKEDDALWERLDALLLTEFESAGGAKLKAERSLIDMGYANQRVLQFCGPRLNRGVYACRGLNRVGLTPPPLLPSQPSRNNRARIPHWNVGVTVAKQTLYDRLVLPVPGPRSMHFAKGHGYDEDHFKQLTAEKLKKRFSYGQPYFIFEKDNASVRNEAMDLWVYNYAALQTLYPLSWDAYELTLKRKEEQAAAAKNAGTQERRPVIRRQSWATRM
jgi:phage terminase large subunit GpA-like protein